MFSFSKINERENKEDEIIEIEKLSSDSKEKENDDISITSTFSSTNYPLEFLRTAHKHLGR